MGQQGKYAVRTFTGTHTSIVLQRQALVMKKSTSCQIWLSLELLATHIYVRGC